MDIIYREVDIVNDTLSNPAQSFMAFGRYLKSMRTQMGIPIETVADEIKISVRQLSLIEAEEHRELPDAVYVKGLLRSYARFIGIDSDDIIDRYSISRSSYENLQAPEAAFFNYSKKNLYRLGLLAGLLIIIIVFSVYMIYGSQAKSLPETAEKHMESAIENDSAAEEAFTADPVAVNQTGKLFLQIDAVEDTSLKITIDDAEPLEYSLHPMDHMELEASAKILLLVRNAAGVKIVFNDEPVFIPGKSGDEVSIELP